MSGQRGEREGLEPFLERMRAALGRSGGLGWLRVMMGNGLYLVLGFASNLVIANGLGPSAYGLLSIALAVMVVLQETCGSGIDLAMVRLSAEHTRTNPRRAQLITRSALHLKLGLTLFITAVLWAMADPLALQVFAEPALATPLRWAAVGLIGASLHGWVLARFQVDERFGAYAVFRALSSGLKLLGLGALWSFAVFGLESVMALSMGVFFAAYGIGVLFVPRSKAKPQTREESRLWLDVLRFGRWVLASHLFFALYSRIDLLLIGKLMTTVEAAFYSVAWNFTFLMDLCTYSVILALLPRVSRLSTRLEYLREVRQIFLLCCGIAVAFLPLWLLAAPMIHLLYPAYSPSVEIFRVLFWGPFVTVLVHPLYLILYARKRVAVLTAVDLVLVLVCAAGCYAWIPAYGMLGAAWATVGARMLNCLLILFLVVGELRSLDSPHPAADGQTGRC